MKTKLFEHYTSFAVNSFYSTNILVEKDFQTLAFLIFKKYILQSIPIFFGIGIVEVSITLQ